MSTTSLLREFSAENATDVPAAIDAGAQRIELCDNMAQGGTSPSAGVIEGVVACAHARGTRVMAMVRPRGGNFEYSAAEVDMMETDARIALVLGADGIVFGCLARTEDGGLDLDRAALARLMAIAREAGEERGEPVDVTFHMAFDELGEKQQLAAIDTLVELGFSRILTHGGAAGTPIEEHVDRLRALVAHAAGRIIILPGGGITHENAEAVAAALGVHEVHGTKIVKLA